MKHSRQQKIGLTIWIAALIAAVTASIWFAEVPEGHAQWPPSGFVGTLGGGASGGGGGGGTVSTDATLTGNGSGGSPLSVANPILVTTTTLTAGQIITLASSPVTIVAAPGSNKVINLIGVALSYHFGTVEFDSTNGQLAVKQASVAVTQTIGQVIQSAIANQYQYLPAVAINGQATSAIQNQPIVLNSSADYNLGKVATSSLGAGGTGYFVNDTGIINDGNLDCAYKVTGIGAGGAVTSYTITAGGTGYPVANGEPTQTGGAQPGIGTNFTVNILTTTKGDGTVKVIAYYQTAAA